MFDIGFRTFYFSFFKTGYYCFKEIICFTNRRKRPGIVIRITISFRHFPLTGNPLIIITGSSLIIGCIIIFPNTCIPSVMSREIVMFHCISCQVTFIKEEVVWDHTIQRFFIQKIIARRKNKTSPCQQKQILNYLFHTSSIKN